MCLNRAVNNALLDTYQLKSLDGLLEASINEVQLIKMGDKFMVAPLIEMEDDDPLTSDNFAIREPYDVVIRCLGFTFDSSIFQ